MRGISFPLAHAAPLPGAQAVVSPDIAAANAQAQAREAARRAAWRATHGQIADLAEPAIIRGKILTPALDVDRAPAAPALRLQFTVDTPGLAEIDAEFAAPSGLQKLVLFHGAPSVLREGSRTITIQDPQGAFGGAGAIGHYAEPGTWTLTRMSIFDNAGASAVYEGSAINAIVADPTFTLLNTGSPDTRPPTLSTGRIVTNTVEACSHPPLVKLSVTASDDVSGIASVNAAFNGTGGTYFAAGCARDAPVGRSGASPILKLEADLSPETPAGVYTIVSMGACDAAGNCFSDASSAEITSVFGKNDHMEVTRSFNCH